MSSPPTPYLRHTSFTDFSTVHPDEQQPGVDLDGEFDPIKITTDQLIARLSEIQRDDGRLRNQSVGVDQIDTTFLKFISATGVPRGAWVTATAYVAKDLVSYGGTTYIAVSAHTSSASFSADLAAGDWLVFSDASGALKWSDYSLTASAAAASANSVSLAAVIARAVTLGVGVVIPSNLGTIYFRDQVTIPAPGCSISIDVPYSTELDWATYGVGGSYPDSWCLGGKGSFVALGSLSGDIATDGLHSYTLAVAPAVALVEEDCVFLVDKTNKWNPVPARNYWRGEATFVRTAVGAAVTLADPMFDHYAAASTVVSKLVPIKISLRGLRVKAMPASNVIPIVINNGRHCYIDRCEGTNGFYAGIELRNCIESYVSEVRGLKHVPDGGAGNSYAISIAACQRISISRSIAKSARHGGSVGAYDDNYTIINRQVVFHECTITHDSATPVDVDAADLHGDAELCGYINCFVEGGAGWGGHRNFLIGGTVRSGSYYGMAASGFNLSEALSLSQIFAPDFLDVRGNSGASYGVLFNMGASGSGLNVGCSLPGTFIWAPKQTYVRFDGGAGTQYMGTVRNFGSNAQKRFILAGNINFGGLDTTTRCGGFFFDVSTGSNFDQVDFSGLRGDFAVDCRDTLSVIGDGAVGNCVGFGATNMVSITSPVGANMVSLRGLKGLGGSSGFIVTGGNGTQSADLTGVFCKGFSGLGISIDSAGKALIAAADLSGAGITLATLALVEHVPGLNDGTVTIGGSVVDYRKMFFKQEPLIVNFGGVSVTGLTAGATNKMNFTNVTSGKGWDAGAQRFDVPTTGKYRIEIRAYTPGAAIASTSQVLARKNGATVLGGMQTNGLTAATDVSSLLAGLVDLVAGDYIEGFVALPAGCTSINGDNGLSYMHIEQVW